MATKRIFMIFFDIFAFIFGAAIGSFLNVCIYRIPAETSIVKPSSRCPSCGHPIRFYDNIPILSFLFFFFFFCVFLVNISWRYPLI